MRRLTILRAAIMAALAGAWLPTLYWNPGHLVYPAGIVALKLFGRGLTSGPDDQGTMWYAWALGPATFIINTLTCLPVTLAVAYVCRRSAFLVRLWDIAVLAAGTTSLILGVYSGGLTVLGYPLIRYPSEFPEDYYFFFYDVPLLVCGAVSLVICYRLILRDLWRSLSGRG